MVWRRTTPSGIRIDNRINAIAEHNDKDVITIAEVNLNDSTVTSLDEEGVETRLRLWATSEDQQQHQRNMMNMP